MKTKRDDVISFNIFQTKALSSAHGLAQLSDESSFIKETNDLSVNGSAEISNELSNGAVAGAESDSANPLIIHFKKTKKQNK
ncbi:hypothetical protein OUZ56_021150 [Daphnia magna]|uniref:Uncharacterized protein n=1 Tax=Daphnia magna TaxID=35525 RepID=A0ABQ9ZGI7_9CRUS|nr:hypothetical protein OUZ56_021150 [Daphnia magna]